MLILHLCEENIRLVRFDVTGLSWSIDPQLTLRIYLDVGSFDMKASRVQECGSMDMSKFGHSQTGKIKSKHNFLYSTLIV